MMGTFAALDDALSTYSKATGISLTLLGSDGKLLESYGQEYTYCKQLQKAIGAVEPCLIACCQACEQAYQLGESYISFCPGGLLLCTVPIVDAGKYVGGIIAGPVLIDYPDISAVDEVIKKQDIGLEFRSQLFLSLSALPLVDTVRIRHLARLLFLLVSSVGKKPEDSVQGNIDRSTQQALIGEYIQRMKYEPANLERFYHEEQQLILSIIAGDSIQATASLNKALGIAFLISSGNVDMIRAKVIELIAHISQKMMEVRKSSDLSILTDVNFQNIAGQTSFSDLSYAAVHAVQSYIKPRLTGVSQTHSAVIEKSIQYICRSYCGDLTLGSVAQAVGINPAYLSSLFKKEMGLSFSDYVLMLRVEHAKHLLRTTSLPIIDIAGQMGFESQSYFSSVFKKQTGVSPRAFRRQLLNAETALPV